MRILITGGFGLIGGRLAVHLAQAGHEIVLASRIPILPVGWLPDAEVVQIDWSVQSSLEYICRSCDVVIHAAGMNAKECAAHPAAAMAFNGVSTSHLVDAACKMDVKKFIYLSTAHVYGSPLEGIITEESCPRNLHPYATSHLAGEHSVLWATKRGSICGVVLRLSNAFGAPVHKNVNCWMLLVNNLCRQAVESNKLKLSSAGKQYRDFIPITDVCRVIADYVLSNLHPNTINIYNLGAGSVLSVLEMATLIKYRALVLLGIEPSICFPDVQLTETPNLFLYRTLFVDTLPSHDKFNHNIEVDQLLMFCKSTFAPV